MGTNSRCKVVCDTLRTLTIENIRDPNPNQDQGKYEYVHKYFSWSSYAFSTETEFIPTSNRLECKDRE